MENCDDWADDFQLTDQDFKKVSCVSPPKSFESENYVQELVMSPVLRPTTPPLPETENTENDQEEFQLSTPKSSARTPQHFFSRKKTPHRLLKELSRYSSPAEMGELNRSPAKSVKSPLFEKNADFFEKEEKENVQEANKSEKVDLGGDGLRQKMEKLETQVEGLKQSLEMRNSESTVADLKTQVESLETKLIAQEFLLEKTAMNPNKSASAKSIFFAIIFAMLFQFTLIFLLLPTEQRAILADGTPLFSWLLSPMEVPY